jgi:outer membrane protein OmpA-like peptidoglycan-associated protein
MRRKRQNEIPDDLNIYQSLADLMTNAFMIAILFLLIALIKSLVTQKDLLKKMGNPEHQKISIQELEKENKRLQTELETAKKLSNAPPIIVIEDSDKYKFALGSAEISPELQKYLSNQIVIDIKQNTQKYGINLVEIIGHTDGTNNQARISNLDNYLEQVPAGKIKIGQLKSGSNADLGLMRALAVSQVFQQLKNQDSELKNINFRAYSAAQLVLPNGQLSTNNNRQSDQQRRRIEIRFTRLGQEIKK